MSTPGISLSLHDSLRQITALADNKNIPLGEKSEKLSRLAEPVLQMLENTIKDVGGTRRQLLEGLKGIIQSGDWAKLPSPSNMDLTLDKLERIGFSIQDAKNNLTTDAESILRLLLEIMRKSMLENKFHQTIQHKMDIDAANAAKTARSNANNEQLSSDLASSIAQGVAAVAGLAGSAVSMWKSGASSLKAQKAVAIGLKNTADGKRSLARVEVDLANNKNELRKLRAELRDVKQEIAEFNKLTITKNRTPEQNTRLNELSQRNNNNLAKITSLDKECKNLETKIIADNKEHKKRDFNIRSETKDSDVLLAEGNAFQSLFGGISGLTNSLGGIASASEKFDAGTEQAKADQAGIEREVAQKMFQAAGESASSAKEGMRAAIGMISAIQQTLGNLGSTLAKNSV